MPLPVSHNIWPTRLTSTGNLTSRMSAIRTKRSQGYAANGRIGRWNVTGSLYANKGDLEFLQRGADWEVEHPKGYFQPGVLSLTNSGRILYRWRSVPCAENLNGTLAEANCKVRME